jgi:hypothetical protein
MQKARNPVGSAHFNGRKEGERSALVLGLREANWGLAVFPFATLLEEFDTLEALEDGTFAADGGVRLEAIVLGHLGMRVRSWEAEAMEPMRLWQPEKGENFHPVWWCWVAG